ncbi:hypothetical protein KBF38_22710 [bacterium]|nr:hypothetical protein [bacterium]
MNTPISSTKETAPAEPIKSVAATILSDFFDALDTEEGLIEVSPRLRKVVLEDGAIAEPQIKAALFQDVP